MILLRINAIHYACKMYIEPEMTTLETEATDASEIPLTNGTTFYCDDCNYPVDWWEIKEQTDERPHEVEV